MSVDLTKYNTAAKICGHVWTTLKEMILTKQILDVKQLEIMGDTLINDECNKIYKREKVKGIAFPTSISLNNCVGYYLHEQSNKEYNVIKDDDVIKIELGVNIGGCIAVLGETIVNEKYLKYVDFLDQLQKDIVKMIVPGEINDEIKIHIESKCTEIGCFPVENNTSYQQLDNQLNTQESKCIITNYKKYYDEDDNLLIDNLCYEFEENEVYTINLTIIPNNNDQTDETEHLYIERHPPHIYRCNEFYYNLKLKSSREFYSNVKNKYNTNAFSGLEYKNDVRSRIGIKESMENGILDSYPIYYSKDNYPIFHKKFTIVVCKDKSIQLKY